MIVAARNLEPRVLMSALSAIVVTFGLLMLMAKLVVTHSPNLDETPYPNIPPVVLDKPKPVEPPYEKPKRHKVEEPPVVPPSREWADPGTSTVAVPAAVEGFDPPKTIGHGSALPFARVMPQPRYPAIALRRGVEGFVDLRFDVAPSGATRNIQVLRAQPEGVFEEAAVRAVQRWRFQPKIVDGQAVAFEGLSKRLRFQIGE